MAHGTIEETIDDYLKLAGEQDHFHLEETDETRDMQITDVVLLNKRGRSTNEVPHTEEFWLSIKVNVNRVQAEPCFVLLF